MIFRIFASTASSSLWVYSQLILYLLHRPFSTSLQLRIITEINSSILFLGLLTLGSVSWYTAMITQDFFSYTNQDNLIRYEIGAALYLGYVSAFLSLVTGLSCFACPGEKDDVDEYPRPNHVNMFHRKSGMDYVWHLVFLLLTLMFSIDQNYLFAIRRCFYRASNAVGKSLSKREVFFPKNTRSEGNFKCYTQIDIFKDAASSFKWALLSIWLQSDTNELHIRYHQHWIGWGWVYSLF